ncbi:T9SS-dependent choice-of-anchor J family protein [Riemerella anatipestifer]|uniref:T9SS-dependent choice-of-anchor J family protein n=1 Tax=Riemerella anatipestifer TaxID=34085 RepID=UPI0004DC3704|nr:choice-of-anchor J domain-containing protein [Riemerella anatipestifer]AIH02093.1 Cleaved adhesin domain protein [Riemerella anatipestifer CH3]MBT0548773.1 T9SS type A sorting domain-containing protein [Riemerella anatipestifer]MBT0555086.1 T9SS type A sorting domain-containing protein [Riemerella anatipestifer]MBT0559536.1 T9SS type A sorting domain-containing protein [Riemerella anatipestifer]MCD5968365.1 T9SS type A sorting domain-containing protein [Riemerella anatipestifer]
MKKIYLIVSVISGFLIDAQGYQENFDGIGKGLQEWTLYGDNGVPEYYVADYQEPWIEKNLYLYNLNPFKKFAISTSKYTDSGIKADRWMVSPVISVTSDNHTLYWEEYAVDPQNPDGFKIKVSENAGNKKEDFIKEIYSVESASNRPTFKSLDLSEYIGKTIRVAFINNSTDKFLLAIDNIYLGGKAISNPNLLEYAATSSKSVEMKWQGSKDVELLLKKYNEVPSSTDKGIKVNGDYTIVDDLEEGTLWHAYLKDNKSNAMWIGPYPVGTAYNLPYKQDFEGDVLKQNIYAEDFLISDKKIFDQGENKFIMTSSIADDITFNQFYLPPIFIPKGANIRIKFDMMHVNNLAEPQIALYSYDIRGNRPSYLWHKDIEEFDKLVVVDEEIGSFGEDGVYNLAFVYKTNYNPTNEINVLCIDNLQIGTIEQLSVHEAKQDKAISIAPNPASSHFVISHKDQLKTIEVFDTLGRMIKSYSPQNQYDIQQLPKGVYLVKISTKDNYTVIKKLIKK